MSIARYDDTSVDDLTRKDEDDAPESEGEVWDFGKLDEQGLMQIRDLINKILKEQYGHTA